MHIHLHTETVVRNKKWDSSVKDVYKRCRCGAEKHVRIAVSSDRDFWRLRVTENAYDR